VWAPDVNVVDVAVTFHPAPEPVASPTSKASGAVTVWLVPFRVVAGNVTVPAGVLLMNARLPPVNVTDAVVAACEVIGTATRANAAAAETAADRRKSLVFDVFILVSSETSS